MSIVARDDDMPTIEHKVAGIPDTVPPDGRGSFRQGVLAYETVAL
jgi:hypothetical protein